MTARWMCRGRTRFAIARHVVLALGTRLALVGLVHSGAAQTGQAQTPTPQPSGPASVSNAKPIAPHKVPPFAPTQPWRGPLLPDGQPDLPDGIWQPAEPGTRYIDKPPAGFVMASRVVDPPDGLIPYQPWARELKKTQDDDLENPTKPWHIDTQGRCLNTVPRLMHYVTDYEIVQSPGFIVFHFQLEHISRVIPLDGRPHIGSSIKLWVGDARGRWEGNTLVVDTTNLNGKGRMTSSGDFHSTNMHLKERMTFVDATTMIYEATIDDPTVFTRPWTMRVAHKLLEPKTLKPGREPEGEIVEYMCYEGEETAGVPSQNPATRP